MVIQLNLYSSVLSSLFAVPAIASAEHFLLLFIGGETPDWWRQSSWEHWWDRTFRSGNIFDTEFIKITPDMGAMLRKSLNRAQPHPLFVQIKMKLKRDKKVCQSDSNVSSNWNDLILVWPLNFSHHLTSIGNRNFYLAAWIGPATNKHLFGHLQCRPRQ